MSLYAVTAKVYVIPSIQGMVRECALFLITQGWKSGIFLYHALPLFNYQSLIMLHFIYSGRVSSEPRSSQLSLEVSCLCLLESWIAGRLPHWLDLEWVLGS